MLTRLPKVLMAAVPGCLLLSVAMIALCASQSRARSIAAFCSTIPGKELRTGVSQPAGRQSTLEPQSYKIRIDFREPLRATVQAILTFPDGRLFTHEHAGGYEWSDFIKDIQATREDGSVIPIQSLGPGQWGIKASKDEAVRLSYDVDLSFAEEMREGTQRGGQFFGNSLYIVNRSLFVMSNAVGPRHVEFVVPPGFQIATPWHAVTPSGYQARDNSELADNFTVIGSFPSFKIAEGDFHLDMVMPGGTQATQALIEPVVRSVLHEYIRIFPNTPDFHVLMAVFRGVEINGEGYRDSAALTYPEQIEMGNRVLWASYLAHELFHHWNGDLIAGSDEGDDFGTTEWFAEGGTEYIANRTVVRAGIIDRSEYIRKMETNIGMYEYWTWAAPFRGTSIQNAGAKTALPMPPGMIAKTYNRAGVYNGGWVASFCLDTKIQTDTQGKKGLEDVFRLMFAKFGITGKQWKPQDLVRVSSEVAGTDLSSFFRKYIADANPLPVQEYLANAGFDGLILDYGGEANVTPTANPNRLAQEIREHLWAKAW
jgi:predicted metalloprotease with PDZ domain